MCCQARKLSTALSIKYVRLYSDFRIASTHYKNGSINFHGSMVTWHQQHDMQLVATTRGQLTILSILI